MVSRLISIALLCALTTSSVAKERCTKGSEYEPSLCVLSLPRISQLTIVENAAKSPAEKDSSVSCDNFSIKEKQVRRYFAKAKATNVNDAHHTLDWSPCYASGKIVFRDGRSGLWSIDQYRVGSLVIDDGNAIVLYCPSCKFKPFQW